MAKPIRALLSKAALAALLASPALAQEAEPDRGGYLAGRYAMRIDDITAAAPYFQRALEADPTRRPLQHDTLAALIGAKQYEASLAIADTIAADEKRSQLSNAMIYVDLVNRAEWRDVLEHLEAGYTAGPLLDSLLRGWARLGLDQPEAALSAFGEIAEDQQQRPFGQYHKALALGVLGQYEEAATLLALPPSKGVPPTRQAVVLRVQVLSQLARFDEALEALNHAFESDNDTGVQALRRALAAQEPIAVSGVTSAQDGVAESFYSVAETVAQSGSDSFVALLYARMTEWTNPKHEEAHIASARLLAQMGQYDLALENYAQVSEEAAGYIDAQTGRAMILRDQGKPEEALAILKALSERFAQMPLIAASYADMLRSEGAFAEARAAYDTAISLYPEDAPARWVLYFSRAVAAHEAGDKEASEQDLRAALALNPRQASVLNYLGYSLIERQKDLDEALRMIEQAIALEPRSGAIIDSLGWAYFRLSRYEEAVVQLERAVTLEATSYEINDHLGDAYWAVGRKREAAFQWRRAVSFAQTESPEAVSRIQAKLDKGLDAVLEEEGQPALSGREG